MLPRAAREAPILRICLFAWTVLASAQTITLPYRPVTAEYSNSLDRIIFIAANPNQLHIFDPATNSDTAVNLPKPPLSLSVSLDGNYAAVGHDALISYVNLQTASLEKTLTANVTVNSLVLGKSYVYVLTYNGGTQSIAISTGVTISTGVYNGTTGRLHPSGTALYTTEDGLSPEHLQVLDVSSGPATFMYGGPYHGDYAVCGGVWFSPDGRRAYTGCATAYQAAPQHTGLGMLCCGSGTLDTNSDGLYWASLPGANQVRSLTESSALGRVAAIPSSYQYGPAQNDYQVFLYDSTYLEPAGTLQLPDFVVNGKNYQAHGRQVFFNQASSALYVVIQADGASGLLNDFAVQVFPLSNPSPCTATFNVASNSAPASGIVGSVAISAPASCIYQANSAASWIQVVSGAYGSGNGTLTYIVRPNFGSDRTGTINIGGQMFTITQSAVSALPNSLVQLGYSVMSADFSKALDKLVVIVSKPKELHIYDPVAGSDRIVALPKSPLCLSVSPDGLSAAVGYDGWVSIVNLATASITSTTQVFTDVHTILLAGNGYFYAYPQRTWASLFSVRIATAGINYASAIYNGRYPRIYADGNTFYTEGSKWDISTGPAMPLNQGSASGCAPFWLTEDGLRMITSCGKSYTTSPVPSLDLQYSGSFSNASSIQWAAESARLHSTAVIPSVGYTGTGNQDTYMQIYGDAYLGYAGDVLLPSFTVGSTSYAGRGRYLFYNAAADKLIVLEQADAAAKLAADYGVAVFDLTRPAAGCNFSLGAVSVRFNANGGLDSTTVTTGDSCIWQAVSGVPWITINSGAVGFGTGTLTYTVAGNLDAGDRTGTLTIAGQTFTVSQAGRGAPFLSIQKTHSGNFLQGQHNATYTIVVSNAAGAGRTSGAVNVIESLPPGLALVSISGAGWMCSGSTCGRSDPLNGGANYPPITVTVNVALNATSPQVNSVSVSGPAFLIANATDTTIITRSVNGSFAGQGEPDLVWQNETTRQVTVHYYGGAGGAVDSGWNWLYPSMGASGWHIAAVADFNGDGVSDLIWQDDNTRQVTVHYYAPNGVDLGWNWLYLGSGALGWHVVAAADFNGDGVPDLVWQHDGTRQVVVHYYGGASKTTDLGWAWLYAGMGAAGWHVAAAADFNSDGVPDIVWQNDATSQVTVHYYGGTGGSTDLGWNWLYPGTGAVGWHIAKAIDFNGDGVADLVWQNNTTGQATIHYYSGGGGAIDSGWNWLYTGNAAGWSIK